jgi:polyphosphate kinase
MELKVKRWQKPEPPGETELREEFFREGLFPFDWSKILEAEGVHVVYGLPGFKTHSKIAMVVRKEGDHIRRYVHLATGNYNAITARMRRISSTI